MPRYTRAGVRRSFVPRRTIYAFYRCVRYENAAHVTCHGNALRGLCGPRRDATMSPAPILRARDDQTAEMEKNALSFALVCDAGHSLSTFDPDVRGRRHVPMILTYLKPCRRILLLYTSLLCKYMYASNCGRRTPAPICCTHHMYTQLGYRRF